MLLLVLLVEWGVHSIRGKYEGVPPGWILTSWATSDELYRLSTSHSDAWVQLELASSRAVASRNGASVEAVACRASDSHWYELPGKCEAGVWSTGDAATVARLRSAKCLAKLGIGAAGQISYVAQPSTGANAVETVQITLFIGLILGVPVAFAVLVGFRRRVVKGLRDTGSNRVAIVESLEPSSNPAARLEFLMEPTSATEPSALLRTARRLRMRLTFIWLVAAAVVALVSAWMYAPDQALVQRSGEFGRLWLLCVGPIALPLLGLVALHRTRLAWVCACYFGLLLLSSILFGPDSGLTERLGGLILPAFASTLALVLAHRRVRAFVPVIILTALLFLGAQLPLIVLAKSPSAVAVFSSAAAWLGFKAAFGPLSLAGLIVALFTTWLSWALLRALGRRYHTARLSDRVLVGMLVTLFTVLLYTVASSELAVFASFLPVVALVVVAARSAPQPPPLPRILFLRVFARGSRVADRFDELCRDLLNVARVDMIAGPDLATAVVQPAELLDFLVGKFSRKYIHDLRDFAARADTVDTRPDLEGRQRVRDFYCTNTIWKDVFRELAQSAALVIIDLSQFTRQRAGVAYELEALVHSYPLERVLALTDESTDRSAVAGVLDQAWNALPPDSPNRARPSPLLPVFDVRGDDPKRLRIVLDAICRIIAPS